MSHTHLLRTEVGWCTIDAVTLFAQRQYRVALSDMSRLLLVRTSCTIAVVQRLSEEDIVVWPDGGIGDFVARLPRHHSHTHIVSFGNGTASIDKVTILITFLYIAHIAILRFVICRIVACLQVLRQDAVLPLQVLVLRYTGQCSMVVIAFVQIEAIQVISHGSIVELTFSHTRWDTVSACMVGIFVRSVIFFLIVTVHDADRSLVCNICRITKYRFRGLSRSICCANPTVLHITLTRFCYTSTCECTRHTEVIDIAAEATEQRVVQTADGIAVAM